MATIKCYYVFIIFISPLIATNSTEKSSKVLFGLFNKKTTTPEPASLKSCDCTCGETNQLKIINGENATENEFPWMVQLNYFNSFYCGGTLINDRYVLTAAHCVKGFMWFLIKVTFGVLDRCETQKPVTRFVTRSTTGAFSYLNFKNDIALLRLNDRVPFSKTISPICLPKNYRENYIGKMATVSGWGLKKEDGTTSCVMQKVQLPVISNMECKNTNYSEEMISEKMMCAGYPEGGKDSCKGDSGGPLVLQREDDDKYEIIGVVSWGNGCARAGYPGVYTRITHFLDWINENTKDACFCTN